MSGHSVSVTADSIEMSYLFGCSITWSLSNMDTKPIYYRFRKILYLDIGTVVGFISRNNYTLNILGILIKNN